MRAMVVREYGTVPVLCEVADPAGPAADVLAASLNPVDVAVAAGMNPFRRPAAWGTSLPIPGCPAPSRRGNPAFRNSTSADAPEQPVLDVPNQPDSHRPRRTERRLYAQAG